MGSALAVVRFGGAAPIGAGVRRAWRSQKRTVAARLSGTTYFVSDSFVAAL